MPMALQKSIASDLSRGKAFKVERLLRDAATLKTLQEMRDKAGIASMMREPRTDHLREEEAEPSGNHELNTGAALQSCYAAAHCGNQLRHARAGIASLAGLCHGLAQPRFDFASEAIEYGLSGGHHAFMETPPSVPRGCVAR